MAKLKKDVFTRSYAKRGGRLEPVADGPVEAGTLVDEIEYAPSDDGAWLFAASSDGGKAWWWQRSRVRPQIEAGDGEKPYVIFDLDGRRAADLLDLVDYDESPKRMRCGQAEFDLVFGRR